MYKPAKTSLLCSFGSRVMPDGQCSAKHSLPAYSQFWQSSYLLRGPGSKSGGSWKLVFRCFLTEDSEIYQLLFTLSKILNPTKIIAGRKLALMCNSIACANFNHDFPKMAILFRPMPFCAKGTKSH